MLQEFQDTHLGRLDPVIKVQERQTPGEFLAWRREKGPKHGSHSNRSGLTAEGHFLHVTRFCHTTRIYSVQQDGITQGMA